MSDPVKVLIADDNLNMRKTLKNILYVFDCTIIEAETGEEAFERISKEYFDVVFFDNKLRLSLFVFVECVEEDADKPISSNH